MGFIIVEDGGLRDKKHHLMIRMTRSTKGNRTDSFLNIE
jgi:hypothetical protein